MFSWLKSSRIANVRHPARRTPPRGTRFEATSEPVASRENPDAPVRGLSFVGPFIRLLINGILDLRF